MFVFLSETKASDNRMEFVAKAIGFPHFTDIGLKGRAGGICLLWAKEIDVELLEFNANTIAIKVRECNVSWALIGFSGPSNRAKKLKAWTNLHAFLETIEEWWLCFGDLNTIIDDIEKDRGKSGSSSTLSFLKNLLFDLGVVDLGFSGNKFTWSNKRWGRHCIRERLVEVL